MDTHSLYDLILEKCNLNPFIQLEGGKHHYTITFSKKSNIISFLEETQLELRFSKDIKVNLPLYKDVFYDAIEYPDIASAAE